MDLESHAEKGLPTIAVFLNASNAEYFSETLIKLN